MKTKSILLSMLFAATAFTLMTGCSGEKKDQAKEHEGHEHASGSTASEQASEPQFDVDDKFQEQLSVVFASYVELKDALVASDAAKTKTEAAEAKQALAQVDMKLLTGAAHNDWMNYLSPIETALNTIEGSDDIETQRQSFSELSDHLYKSVKAFGLGGKEAFYEFCPMAFNNEGAYWLSDKQEIRNPYFGDAMLTCGVVKEKLK